MDDWQRENQMIDRHEKDARKRSWALLRKYCSRKDLAKKGLFKEYDYLDLLAVPSIERRTPVLPQHSDSTDLLFVNHDDEIVDTVGTRIYKLNVHHSKSSEAKAATPASASTIPHSFDSGSRVVLIRIQKILPRSNSSYVFSFLFETC